MQKRLRVLHILEATLGGTRQYLQDMVNSGALDNFDCSLIYSKLRADTQFKRFLLNLRKRKWKLYEVKMKREISLFSDLQCLLRIREIIRDLRPDIVHCHSSKAGALGRIAAASLKDFGNRTVYTPNALAINLGKRYIYLERVLTKFTRLFIAISDSEKQEILKFCKVPAEKVYTVWPTIDCDFFRPMDRGKARKLIGLSKDARVVIGIGRLSDQKNPLSFVEMCFQLKKKNENFQAIWVGGGEMLDRLNQLTTGLNYNEFLVTGWIEDVRAYIAAANVTVLSSKYESFGYVTAESLAMKRPVVSSRVNGSIDLIVDGQNGYIVDAVNSRESIKRITELLSSRKKQSQFGAAGRKRILKRFSNESMRSNLRNAYNVVFTGR